MRLRRRRIAVCGDVVDFSLPFFSSGRRNLPTRSGRKSRYGWRQAQQFSDRFPVSAIFPPGLLSVHPDRNPFRRSVWQFPRRLSPVFPAFAGRVWSERYADYALPCCPADFTGDVQRQVIRINQAAHETQIVRHELLGIVHNEHALGTYSFRPCFCDRGSIGDPTAPGCDGIYTAGCVLLLTFHAVVAPCQRIGEIMRDVLVNSLYLSSSLPPTCCGSTNARSLVDFPVKSRFRRLFFPFFNLYRQCDAIGIFTDNRAYAPVIEELPFAFTQV